MRQEPKGSAGNQNGPARRYEARQGPWNKPYTGAANKGKPTIHSILSKGKSAAASSGKVGREGGKTLMCRVQRCGRPNGLPSQRATAHMPSPAPPAPRRGSTGAGEPIAVPRLHNCQGRGRPDMNEDSVGDGDIVNPRLIRARMHRGVGRA